MKTSRVVKGMTLAHTTEGGTEVYVAKTVSKGNLENGFKIIVMDKEFNCSDAKYLGRNADVVARTLYLSDVADLITDDAGKVAQFINDNFENSINTVIIMEKMNLRDVFKILFANLECTETVDGFYIINTDDFKVIVEGCGWTSLGIQKILKSSDMLKPNAGRIYDYNKKDENGKSNRYLRINAKALKEEAALSSDEQEVK